VLCTVLLLLAGAATVPAATAADDPAAPSSRRELRSLYKEAAAALDTGRYDDAAGLYQRWLDAAPGDDSRRPKALYEGAVAEILRPAEHRDLARAAAHLGELHSTSPGDDRGRDTAVLLSLLETLDDQSAAVERLGDQLDELRQGLAAEETALEAENTELEQQTDELASRLAAAEAEAEALRAERDDLRSQLTAARTELERKQQALDRVKETLVGN